MGQSDVPQIISADDCSAVSLDTQADPDPDCACPIDDPLPHARAALPADSKRPYVCVDDLYTDSLGNDLRLVFNPRGHGGVVMLNGAACRLLADFAQPRPLDALAPALRPVARRLAALELIVPAGTPPQAVPDSRHTLTAWLHVTNACNLRCTYCYLKKTTKAMDLTIGRQAIASIFRSAEAHGFRAVKLKYAGGEASLNLPLVLALHTYAQALATRADLGLRGVLLTNGVALNDQAINDLCQAGLQVTISLDGVGAIHDAQRPFVNGRGSFTSIEHTLDRLAAHAVTPSVTITLTAHNLARLPEVLDYTLDRKLPFRLNFYRENDCTVGRRDLDFSDEAAMVALRAAFARIAARPPNHSLLSLLTDRARMDAPHNRPCGAGHSYLVVDQWGAVATCHMQIEQQVAHVSAPDLLGAVLAANGELYSPHVEAKVDCQACPWRYQCAGGCPALAQRVNGSVAARSPYCNLYRMLFPEVLRLESARILTHAAI